MSDPVVHALVGAQFGDLEYDVGKSVRWTQWFTDTVHVTDINTGTQRYWVVNWEKTFPEVAVNTTGLNFFSTPEDFRQYQWAKAKAAWNIQPTDWILFVDAHEGLSFDNRSLPDDYSFAPFRSWVWREIARAEAALADRVVLPFYVFCRSDEVQNVEIDNGDPDFLNVQQALATPYYEANQGLTRLIRADVLDGAFDWSEVDQLSTPDVDVKAQIISYGYAHWQYMNIEDPAVGIPPLDESNDKGWEMRKLISRVRPIASFPVLTWDANDQPAGLPGPWAVDTASLPDPDLPSQVIAPVTPTADVSMEPLRTPLYDTAFRLNLRDGVWYESGVSGNTPLYWDETAGEWKTNYDPDLWPDQGVGAHYEAAPLDPPTNFTVAYDDVLIEANLSWGPPDVDYVLVPSIDSYLIEHELDGELYRTYLYKVGSLLTDYSRKVTYLEDGDHRFRVCAVNRQGSGPFTDWSTVETIVNETAPVE